MTDETATLAAYVADLKYEASPPEGLDRAKVLTLDFLGSAIRARRDAESTPSLLKMLESLALDGKGHSTVFGDNKTWTPAVAALLNGALGHSLDFDDTHADSSLHPSAPVVPAAFAVGELVGASGRGVKPVRAPEGRDCPGVRRLRQPGRGLAAISGHGRLEQALPGWRRRHERRDRRDLGAQRFRRRDGIGRGQARAVGRLQRQRSSRQGGLWPGIDL